jgi:TPP-dependent pyruvate/acetoin dehydrogenase alpha subunit
MVLKERIRSSSDGDERLVGRADEPRDARLYRRMRFIRRFEQTLLDLFEEGVLNGTTHACIGQEANSVAVVEHLREGDHIFSNHRCHGHFLAWSGNAYGLMREIMGKPDGLCAGIGGSQHICAPGFKSNGVQGGIVPAATGIAHAKQLRGTDELSVVFIGDGTLGEGSVYEALNIASLWHLPLLVVLEDNAWAQSTPAAMNMAGDMAARFEAFGFAVADVDSTDVVEIDAAASSLVSQCRAGQVPAALIVHTYRLCHHSKNDDNRPKDEVLARWELDPLVIQGARLSPEARREIDDAVEAGISDVVQRARQQ